MKNVLGIAALLLAFVAVSLAQSPSKTVPQLSGDITGLYSFVHEGEFVQIELNDGKVTGLVSRFKDDNLERAEFVDQFFQEGKLEGAALSFRTNPADGTWYEFSGSVERGPAKTPSDEGYWNVRGILTERHTGADGKALKKAQALTLKSFPQDTEPNATRGSYRDKKE